MIKIYGWLKYCTVLTKTKEILRRIDYSSFYIYFTFSVKKMIERERYFEIRKIL